MDAIILGIDKKAMKRSTMLLGNILEMFDARVFCSSMHIPQVATVSISHCIYGMGVIVCSLHIFKAGMKDFIK